MSNRLSKAISIVKKAPKCIQPFLLTKLFSSKVKFAATTGIEIQSITTHQVEIVLRNRKKVQNHIGGIHAVAAAVLAESATGIVFGMNVPDSRLPLLKSMKLEYQRRMQGSLRAVATLCEQQRKLISQQEKGHVVIPVEITDESGQQPIVCEMEWAWVNKHR
ncbi:DUF4442 domain-containing protein [Colwelliaceae bacterium 6441]